MNTEKRQIIDEVIQNKVNSRHPKNPQGERLAEDLGLDSLDVMEIIMECEGKFAVRIYDSKCVGLTVKEDIYKLFEEQ